MLSSELSLIEDHPHVIDAQRVHRQILAHLAPADLDGFLREVELKRAELGPRVTIPKILLGLVRDMGTTCRAVAETAVRNRLLTEVAPGDDLLYLLRGLRLNRDQRYFLANFETVALKLEEDVDGQIVKSIWTQLVMDHRRKMKFPEVARLRRMRVVSEVFPYLLSDSAKDPRRKKWELLAMFGLGNSAKEVAEALRPKLTNYSTDTRRKRPVSVSTITRRRNEILDEAARYIERRLPAET